MKLIGPEPRARQLRYAANRLRWEVDWALGDGHNFDGPHRPERVGLIAADLAEALAIQRQILVTIDAHRGLVDASRVLGGPFFADLARNVAWYRRYHETAR